MSFPALCGQAQMLTVSVFSNDTVSPSREGTMFSCSFYPPPSSPPASIDIQYVFHNQPRPRGLAIEFAFLIRLQNWQGSPGWGVRLQETTLQTLLSDWHLVSELLF